MLYVGQHAMAGTAFAPLRHTQTTSREYYKVDGTFFGEFGGGAIVAGQEGVPTILLAGDDKACLEARTFVPDIETAAVKYGRGVEAADHLDPGAACERVREAATRAVERLDEIPPLTGIEPPFTVEVRFVEPKEETPERWRKPGVSVTWVDDRTVRLEGDTFADLYP